MPDLKVQPLKCQYQTYAWGKVGQLSKVFDLLNPVHAEQLESTQNYAELWLGTHPNGPSLLNSNPDLPLSLKEQIQLNSALYLTSEIQNKFGNDLPFLLKVLSVGTALSIQAHPDKVLAQQLHSSRPDLYKDSNHKPEMAIALTQFEALVGFRPLIEIKNYLNNVPEFKGLVGLEISNEFNSSLNQEDSKLKLKKLFKCLMTSDSNDIQLQLTKLINRIPNDTFLTKELKELILTLNQQYPNDIGIFCVFLLNHCILNKGQAIYLGANEPHAYLNGDCVECMATSDNVVRAGLTPKFKDVNVLTDMLTYNTIPSKDQIMSGLTIDHQPFTKLYDPPIQEFSVLVIDLQNDQTTIHKINGPGILLVTDCKNNANLSVDNLNQSLKLIKGSAMFIPPNTQFNIQTDGDLVAFLAYCEI